MSTANSNNDTSNKADSDKVLRKRFLTICLGIGVLGSLPFYTHPLGLQRPDAWMYTTLNHLLPVCILFWFRRPKVRLPTRQNITSWFKVGICAEIGLILLLCWSVLVGDLQLDWTFQSFKDWTEVQIGQQIEETSLPMPGIPAEFKTLAKWGFWSSFFAPWLLWWVCVPQELVWRGWVADNSDSPKDWIILSTFWTGWQLPIWLLEPQWHLGWWRNNGSLFAQQVISTWLIGIVLYKVRSKWNSITLVAFMVALLTISETWAILIQDTVPFPNWLWIGWNGWWGCLLMIGWLFWEYRHNTKPRTLHQ
jgi:hypothetical protein